MNSCNGWVVFSTCRFIKWINTIVWRRSYGSDKSLVLIDTPAASTESGAVNQLKQLRQAAGVPIKTYWVLAADASEAALREQDQRYCHGRLAGCVVTRMDCAQRLGPLFGLLLETGVAIGYTCQGPAMPQEVQVARAHQLITKAVSLLKTRGQGGKQPLPGPQTTRPSHAKRPGHASASDRTGLAVS